MQAKEKYVIIHFLNIMATFVEITGAEYPQIYKGNQITPMEGVSLFETLKGNVDTERILTFEHSGHYTDNTPYKWYGSQTATVLVMGTIHQEFSG